MKKIFILAAVALGLVSCDLTTDPTTTVTDKVALENFEGMDKAAAVTYVAFASESWYGLDLQIYPDVMCGNCVAGAPLNSGRGMNWQQWNFTASGGFSVYGSAYVNINRCNNVIYALKTRGAEYLKEDGVSQQDLDNRMAECLFVRAFCYFDLVRWYAQPYAISSTAAEGSVEALGVPIVKENPAESVLDKPARALVADNYDAILSDLNTALSLIEAGYTREGVKDVKCAVTPAAIEALLARVYLYMQDYENAEIHASNVLAMGYSVATASVYPNMWTDENMSANSEVIFAVYFDTTESSTLIGNITDPDEYGDVRVSEDLLALFEDGDVRKTTLLTSADHPDYLWPAKYQGKGGLLAIPNVPVLRTSEMYLIRAEARYMQQNNTGAMNDLNVIAENRKATPYTTVSFRDIFNERRKELAFEGHIWHDYKRLIGTEYQGGATPGEMMVRNDVSSTINQNVAFDSKYWCMPISESEIDVNGNLVQNPKW